MARLEHVGIAVADAGAVADLYETLLGTPPYKDETVAREGVRTHFIAAGAAKLELLEALGATSPVAKHLDKRGEGLHHLAFEVDDIHAHHARLTRLGFEPLSEPRPGADGKLIFFLHPKQTHGVLVEFCQSAPREVAPIFVPFGDGRIATYVRGEATRPPVVLVHGAGGSAMTETLPLARHLEQDFHVVAVDFPGHDASSSAEEADPSPDRYARAILAVLDAREIPAAGILGYAAGGVAALAFAVAHPERVTTLALHATPIYKNERASETSRQGPANATPEEDLVDALDLAGIHVPVLISVGDRDADVSIEDALRLRDVIAGSSLAVLPGAGHPLADVDIRTYTQLLRRHFLRLDEEAT